MKARKYSLDQAESDEPVFIMDDVLDLVPVVKQINYVSSDIKLQMETADKLYNEGRVKESIECF